MVAKKNDFELVPYDLKKATIATLEKKYLDLTLPPDDAKSYDMVMGGLSACQKLRKDADDWFDDKKELINKASKHYSEERKKAKAMIIPTEDHLKVIRKAEDDRRAGVKAEKERKEQERILNIQKEINRIAAIPATLVNMSSKEIAKLSAEFEGVLLKQDEFQEFYDEAVRIDDETYSKIQDALIARLAFEKDEKDRKAEAERLEAQRKEQDAKQNKLTEQAAELAKASRLLEAKKKADEQKKREEELVRQIKEKAEKEATEKVEREKQDEIDRAARETKEKAVKEKAEKEEAARQEALKPDKQKLLDFANMILDIGLIDLTDEEAREIFIECLEHLRQEANILKQKAEAL